MKETIENYILAHADDPDSYTFVAVDSIDTFYNFIDDPQFKYLSNKINAYGKLYKENYRGDLIQYEKSQKYFDTMLMYNDSMTVFGKNYKLNPIGYVVPWSYRIKNEFNATVLKQDTFYLNISDSLLSVNDIDSFLNAMGFTEESVNNR